MIVDMINSREAIMHKGFVGFPMIPFADPKRQCLTSFPNCRFHYQLRALKIFLKKIPKHNQDLNLSSSLGVAALVVL